jgi:hypothetical protein
MLRCRRVSYTNKPLKSKIPNPKSKIAMTLKLRHAHRTIWFALAVLLPVGFGTALSMTDKPLRQEPVGPSMSDPLPAPQTADSLHPPTIHTYQP